MIIDYINAYKKDDKTVTATKVNINIQGEVSPPQVIDPNSSTHIAHKRQKQLHCPSPPANFVGNKEERLETLQKFMSILYPRKSKTKSLITLLLDTVTESKKEQFLMLCQTWEILAVAEEDSVNDAIVNNVRCFLSSAKVRGRDTTLELRTKQAILTACTYSGSGNKIELEMIREALAVSTNSFYHKTITRTNKLDAYKPVGPSHRQTKWVIHQRRCVRDFCHSDDSSSIDSNSRKIITINERPHVGRVWLAKKLMNSIKCS